VEGGQLYGRQRGLRVRTRRAGAVALVAVSSLLALTSVAAADDVGDRRVTADTDGRNVDGTAEENVPAVPVDNGGGDGGGPNCTRSDGTPDYLRYGPRLFSTMEEQRTTYHPQEQRPGEWLHLYCGDEWLDFVFLPEAQPVDPVALARSVRITPPAPRLATSPGPGDHLVGVEAWFWADNWGGMSEPATAGSVTVRVSAEPTSLVIDPGDGSPAFTCAGPQPAYDPGLPADAQSSDCTHTYTRAGNYTVTATLVYDVSFTSNVGVAGDLGTVDPSSTTALAVSEAQAINTEG
jgi:hypothetical protein